MNLISDFVVLIFITVFFSLFLKRLKFPQLSILTLSGIVFSLFTNIGDENSLKFFIEILITFLLFIYGLEFSFEDFAKLKRNALIYSFVGVIANYLALNLILRLFEFEGFELILMSLIFSLGSSLIILNLIEQKMSSSIISNYINSSALFIQNLFIIPVVLIFTNLNAEKFVLNDIFISIFKALILIAFALIIAKQVIPRILFTISRKLNNEILILMTVVFTLLFFLIANQFGIHYLFVAFLAGLMMSQSFFDYEILSNFKNLKTILISLTVLGISSLFSIEFLLQNLLVIIGVFIFVLFIKVLISFIITFFFKYHSKINTEISIYISGIGEIAFLMILISFNNQWINQEIFSTILMIIILSLFISPILISNSNAIYERIFTYLRSKFPNTYRKIFRYASIESISSDEINNHIVIFGFNNITKHIINGLNNLEQKYMIIEQDEKLFENSNIKNFIIGEVTNQDILLAARIEKAKACIITISDDFDINALIKNILEINPDIKIINKNSLNIDESTQNFIHSNIDAELELGLIMLEKSLQYLKVNNKSIRNLI